MFRAPFGGNSPSGEVLLAVKQPKKVQLKDLFNILLSIPDVFPFSLDYTSHAKNYTLFFIYSMPSFQNHLLTIRLQLLIIYIFERAKLL